jgi:hypothetical protein
MHNTETSATPWSWADVGNDAVSSLVIQATEPDSSLYNGEETAVESGIGQHVAGSGCARVGDAVRFRNVGGRVIWTYSLAVSFCWNGATITSIWAREVGQDITPLPFPAGLLSSWTYSPVDFAPGEAGHSSTIVRTSGKFEFCMFKHGCLNTRYPWIRIELRGSGGALCTSSVVRRARACFRGKA